MALETVGNIVLALLEAGYKRFDDYEITGDWKTKPLETVLDWRNLTNPMPSEADILAWWEAYQTRILTQEAQKQAMINLMQSWGIRAAAVAVDAAYFKTSSDIIWDAIESGKPDVSGQEIDDLHAAFSTAIQTIPGWRDSHNFVFTLYDVAMNPANPLNATHGAKAFQIIAWYSFNVVASTVAAQAIQLKLLGLT